LKIFDPKVVFQDSSFNMAQDISTILLLLMMMSLVICALVVLFDCYQKRPRI